MVSLELWNHCENPYPFVPAEVLDGAPSVRASLRTRYCEPAIAADLYEEVFGEYAYCDDIGLNIVTNEHHSGINNLRAANCSMPRWLRSMGKTDFFCLGDPDAAADLPVARVHDGWHADDTGGAMAIWGQRMFWEIRPTLLTVAEAAGPQAWPVRPDVASEPEVNVRNAIFRGS